MEHARGETLGVSPGVGYGIPAPVRAGDLVRAAVPSGGHVGTHTGRVAVRSSGIGSGSGSHTPRTPHGPTKTSWKNLRLLQRADGYGYTTQKEAGAPSTA
ncbi:hypothetical protein [Nocardiopsis deserti]|uniref:hypothetical protein n=1 Tax=Nocardiopsis deserti TaxID=2605988 RepID=UPI0016816002|nr:hypothetical protein [Nocardiopsis deserti]